MKNRRTRYLLIALAAIGVAGLVAGLVRLNGGAGKLTGTAVNAEDDWVRGIDYRTTDEVATQMIARLQEDQGWWAEPAAPAEEPDDGVDEPSASVDASGVATEATAPAAAPEPTQPTVPTNPTAKQVNAACLQLLQDKDRTLAPLLDDAYYAGKNVGSLIRPNTANVTGYTQEKPLEQDEAIDLWTGVAFKSRIHDGLLDDDADGIPNYFEKYGFTIRKKSGGGTPFIEPWGIRMKGDSIYARVSFEGIRKVGEYTTGLPIDIVGNDFEIVPAAELDRDVVYFKTDPATGSSDRDPYGDNLEAVNFPAGGGSENPVSAKHPAIAAQPELIVELVDFSVVPDEKTTDSQGRSYPEMRQSQFATLMGWKMPPRQADGRVSLRAKSAPSTVAKSLAIVGTAHAEEGGAAQGGAAAAGGGLDVTGLLGKLPWGDIAKTVIAFFMPQPSGATINTSTAKTTSTTEAARLQLTVKLKNTGTDQASAASGKLVVSQGGKAIANPRFSNYTLGAGGKSDSIVLDGNDNQGKGIILDIDQFKSFTSGGGIDIRVDPTTLDSSVNVPTWNEDGKILAGKSAGKWADYSNDIQANCTTVFIDDGVNGLLRVSIAPGETTTVRDALYWALGSYVYRSGSYELKDLRMRKPDGTWNKVADDVEEMAASGEWKFMFDDVNYQGVDVSNAFDVLLKPKSTVYLFNQSVIEAPVIGSARMMIDGGDVPKKKVTAVIETHNGLTPIEAYFLASARTTPSAANKMTYQDGYYTITLPNHTATGKEVILARTDYPEPSDTYESTSAVDFAAIPTAVTLFDNWGLRSRVGALGGTELDDWVTASSAVWNPRADVKGRENSADGQTPNVAIRHDGTVVAAFESWGLRYRVGTLNPSTNGISWGDRLELKGPDDKKDGVKPEIAIADDGTVVTAYGDSDFWLGGVLRYRVGTVNRAAKTVDWGSRADLKGATADHKGRDVALALSPDGRTAVVIYMPSGKSTVSYYCRVGAVDKTAKTVAWGEPVAVAGAFGGTHPSAAMRNDGTVVFAWEDWGLKTMVGAVNKSDKTVQWGSANEVKCVEDSNKDCNDHPAIALKEDGTVMVILENWGLKYRLGKLDAADKRIDWSVRKEIRQANEDFNGSNQAAAIVDLR